MYCLVLLAFSSCVLALLITPLCRDLFRRWGVVDQPDEGRHQHPRPIPRVGGVAVLAAYLGAFAVLLCSPLVQEEMVTTGLPLVSRMGAAAVLVFALGITDDVHGLEPWQKFAGQGIAAGVAFWAGVQVSGVAGFTVPYWLSLPLTLLWLMGCCNAFNLIDGVDGLAAGAGLLATATIALGALLHGNTTLALATAPLAGALLGFLCYNFNPASIFLGDSGSLTLGFLLGCFALLWGQKSATVLGMTAPLMALSVPLLDTALSISRRYLRRQPIFVGDAGHIHHRLLARGLTPRRVTLLLYGACLLAASLSLTASLARGHFKAGVVVLFCAAAWAGVRQLGYAEFRIAERLLFEGGFRGHLNGELAVHALEVALAKAATPEECWNAVREAGRKLGFTHAELRLKGRCFAATLAPGGGDHTWNVDIPLGEEGHLRLARCFGDSRAPSVLVPLADALHRNLAHSRGPLPTSAEEKENRAVGASG